MMQARSKFMVLAVLSVAIAAQARAEEPRTIHFAPKVTASNDTLGEALVSAMFRFRRGIVQAEFIEFEEKADYAFTDWSVFSTPSTIEVSMKYRGPGAAPKTLSRPCNYCDAVGLETTVYELLDKTLLHPIDGLYRPMRIRQCQEMTDKLSFIRVSVEPANGIALENSLPYVIAEPTDAMASHWRTRPTPHFKIETLDEGSASATFKVIGNAKTIGAFRTQDCSGRMRPLAMQPRVALLTAGVRNGNARRGD